MMPNETFPDADAAAALQSRVTELEIKLTYAEEQLDALNMTIYRQDQRIELLQLELNALRQQMQANLPAEARSLRDELPPHY